MDRVVRRIRVGLPMTMTPAEHYARADALLAELAEAKPEAFRFPFVQAKVARAQIHTQLAQSPWWPGLESLAVSRHDCTGCGCPIDRCNSYRPGHKCCPDCKHLHPGGEPVSWPAVETRSATGDRL